MVYDDKYKLSIATENAPLRPSEQQEIRLMLSRHDIGIAFLEHRSIINSVLDSIPIFLNPDITNLLISGLMMPAVYDALKKCLLYMVAKISVRKNITEEKESGVAFRLNIDNADIYAPIPAGLSDKQFSAYMDMIKNSFTIISKKQEETKADYHQIFIMYDNEREKVDIKTVQDYAKIQMEKKK
ncbi:hypothetical protein [Lacrimispora amygdalina]|uniref:hypothetical protein n=1 Tax=Lacrimispora amygdalina TaxID=253257 RepID=UPI000BE3944C|nr:hypothetical protein [Lacrimispora amygdalina]